MKSRNLLSVIMLLFVISCQDKNTLEEDEHYIIEFNEIWNNNALSDNRAANADLFTESGRRIENGKMYTGREEIRTLLRSQVEQRRYLKSENKIQKMWSSEDFIITDIIQTQSYINSESGDTINKKSAAITIFERQPDGKLRIAYNLKTELKE